MHNPVCAVCGHINRVGAVTCETCDARLYEAGEAGGAEPFGDARPPSEPSGAWAPAEGIPSPPFKGAGDVISPMLAVYRKYFTLIGILVLVTTVPEALLQFGVLGFANDGPVEVVGNDIGIMSFAFANGVILWLLTMAGAALLSGSLVYAVVDVQRVGSASAGECLSRGLKVLPKVFLVSLLYAAVTIVGYIMLIVPGVIFSLMFAVCVPAAVVEGRGPIDSLKRSYELTSGYKGLIFITYFLWGLLVTGLGWVVVWSFTNSGNLDLLSTLLLQTAVLGMLNSSLHVLTVYVYLGLLRERQSGFQGDAFTPRPETAAG